MSPEPYKWTKTKHMKVSDVLYYGAEVKFPKDMIDFWRHYYPERRGYTMHLNHCTLGHKSNMHIDGLLQAWINREEECELVIDAVGHYMLPNGKGEVIAFRVKKNLVTVDEYPMKGYNKTFHITAFTSGEATAKDSNLIEKWELMAELKLTGRIKIWCKEEEKK